LTQPFNLALQPDSGHCPVPSEVYNWPENKTITVYSNNKVGKVRLLSCNLNQSTKTQTSAPCYLWFYSNF
jgi:hypothetical protein